MGGNKNIKIIKQSEQEDKLIIPNLSWFYIKETSLFYFPNDKNLNIISYFYSYSFNLDYNSYLLS